MAPDTERQQSSEGRPQPSIRIGFKLSDPVAGTDGPWLRGIEVRAFLDGKCVGNCDAKLIKEAEYKSDTRHFFSAMDDQSNTMGDLAQLLLWSENRWVFDGPWQGMKEYGDRNPVRECLDEETRRGKGQLTIRRYCTPVLFKPREGTHDHLPFPAKTQWVVLFTDITVAKVYRGRGIDRAMVRMVLSRTLSLARSARRPLLAAVEPGCVQFNRLSISDPRKFEERYGPMRNQWPVVQGIKAKQEKFWLEMGFQKFEKPVFNRDLSNFFFWSGLFDLPESKDIDLTEPGKQLASSTAPDGSMEVPKKKIVRRKKKVSKPKKGKKRGRMDDGSGSAPEQRSEKRVRLDDDMDTEPIRFPQWYEASDQIGDGDLFDSINWANYD